MLQNPPYLPPATSPRPGRWRFRQAPATGSYPTRWEQGDLSVSHRVGKGCGCGRVMRQSGDRATAEYYSYCRAQQAAMVSPEGALALLRVPWPSGEALYEKHTQHAIVLLYL